MDGFNSFIEKRNFKRIFIVFLIIACVAGLTCAGAVGYIFRDRINLALKYEKACENFENESNGTIDTLAAASEDIRDVLVLDNGNNVVYSAKKSEFASEKTFNLKKENSSRFLQNEKNSDAVFRFVKKDEFMISSVFADDFKEIHDEYDEDNFFLDNFQNKNLYLISLLGKRSDGTKAYVISSPTSVQYGIESLKAAACVFMLLFMIYWIIVALWVYQNARKSKLSAPVWGIIVLFTNLAGVLVYLIYKHISGICIFCGAVQPKGNTFCTYCGKKIGTVCTGCGHLLKRTDNYCPKCGRKQD